jgi:hypothetical protein
MGRRERGGQRVRRCVLFGCCFTRRRKRKRRRMDKDTTSKPRKIAKADHEEIERETKGERELEWNE